MADNYAILLSKINEFKQKFYLNKLLRGLIYTAAMVLGLYTILFVSVYYARPEVSTKTFLFIFFVSATFLAAFFLVIKPLLAYLRLSKTISAEEAATFIGNHFTNVKDKLLNTLQLHSLAGLTPENNSLIIAGIDQKIIELKPIPFTNAVNLQDNRKYFKFFFIPLGLIILIGILWPAVLKEGSNSFLQFDKEILPVAPFNFELRNKNLTVTQGDDLTLRLTLSGDQIPQDIYLEDGQNSYKAEKTSIASFNFTLKNLQKDKKVRFSGGGFTSATYFIEVKPRPAVLNLQATLQFPSYLHKKPEEISNAGDLLLPEGTRISWKLNSENSKTLVFILGNQATTIPVNNENQSVFSAIVRNNTGYKIIAKNAFVANKDSLAHQIAVIKDQFPTISVQEIPDSLSSKALYFSGNIADDHGFSSLTFVVNVLENGKLVRTVKKALPIKNNQMENAWFHLWRISDYNLKPGETAEYFFEVADNDGVNGAKKTRSSLAVYKAPSVQEIAEKLNSGSQALKQKMESTIKLAATVEKESKKIAEKMLDKKQLTFEDKKEVEQLLEKQKQLEQAVKEIKEQNDKNNTERKENTELKEELAEKQQQINDLFNNILDEKTKELLRQLEKLVQENNKEQTQEELSKMQLDNKSLKNELDRILELYKQLEFEQNLQNDLNRLNDLARQQKGLSEKSKDKNADNNALKNKQDQLSKEFNELKKDLDKLEDKNNSLERPNPFKSPDKESKEIQQKQQKAGKNLQDNKKQEASEDQKDAGEQMENLAKKMEAAQQEGEDAENKVNAEELRKLLENLLTTSFDQEKTMMSLRRMSPVDPQYITNVQKQRTIKDNMSTIADSLFSLSKRVPQIETAVNEEMQKINFNIEKSLDNLGERRTSEATKYQQYTMTSVNNLALMLNEALEQLQNMQKRGKPGKSGKKGMEQLQEMQDQLNKNMQKARQQLQKEGNDGKPAEKGKMSEQFAKMAQQQQMIREALQKINREDNKDGKGGLGNLNQVIKDMKLTENDLVNKRIQQETLNRQKDVLTKLLDADNAQREQDEDARREAKAAIEFPPSYKQLLEKFKKIQQNETELLQKLPPNLNYYYRNKIAEYYKLLNAGQ